MRRRERFVMRLNLFTGLLLTCAAVLVVVLGAALDAERVAAVGLGAGAVLALVPDRGPLARVGAFSVGFVAAWAGYVARAALLPDSTGGRAVALGVVVAVVVGAAIALKAPLWAGLLGVVALAGGYETAYTAAPAEIAETSVDAVTSLLLVLGVGFLAGAASSLMPERHAAAQHAEVAR